MASQGLSASMSDPEALETMANGCEGGRLMGDWPLTGRRARVALLFDETCACISGLSGLSAHKVHGRLDDSYPVPCAFLGLLPQLRCTLPCRILCCRMINGLMLEISSSLTSLGGPTHQTQGPVVHVFRIDTSSTRPQELHQLSTGIGSASNISALGWVSRMKRVCPCRQAASVLTPRWTPGVLSVYCLELIPHLHSKMQTSRLSILGGAGTQIW
jgi:hypothetical protein